MCPVLLIQLLASGPLFAYFHLLLYRRRKLCQIRHLAIDFRSFIVAVPLFTLLEAQFSILDAPTAWLTSNFQFELIHICFQKF